MVKAQATHLNPMMSTRRLGSGRGLELCKLQMRGGNLQASSLLCRGKRLLKDVFIRSGISISHQDLAIYGDESPCMH